MVWEVVAENWERMEGEVVKLQAYSGDIYTGDDKYGFAVFAGLDCGKIGVYTGGLALEKSWNAHKDLGVNDIAVGEDEHGTVWLYSCSGWGEIIQWWPAALELLYHNSTSTPGSEMDSFTSAGGRLDANVKQLCWAKGCLYSGDDAGKLCKWSSGLSLHWCKDTYADIASLAVSEYDGQLISLLASPIQNQVIVGDIREEQRKASASSLHFLTTLQGKAPVTASRDGQLVFCQSTVDYNILVFKRNGKTLQLHQELVGHTDAVTGLAVSPDSAHLASTSWDGHLKVWRTDSFDLKASISCSKYLNTVVWAAPDELYVGGGAGEIFKIKKN